MQYSNNGLLVNIKGIKKPSEFVVLEHKKIPIKFIIGIEVFI